ncbi:isocitrate lyase/PEP mutase family protein [Microbacterium luticocti]|uniref:isocitrate lyase/PEP mutase family protein n=1 Tax=Microbacterium luticocti TaxID=451764 RepID=UPI000408E95C|nr:isocitrate lyase/phosphoenolpyruvate mutase family protein [Microbacterium luticocti]
MTPTGRADRFRALHHGPGPLLLPNPWDAGSAVLFERLGFQALATTSSGHALSLGLPDGAVPRDQALAGVDAIVRATSLPVTADLESGFGTDAAALADTYAGAAVSGLAGASIEDATGDPARPLFELDEAADRVHAAAEAAHGRNPAFVVTARAEGYLHGRRDLADVIARLQAYQQAGADVLYAPGLSDAGEIRSVVTSVDRPVNVLFGMSGLTVAELAELGVARISIGGSFAFAAYGAAALAAREFLEHGTNSSAALARAGHEAMGWS